MPSSNIFKTETGVPPKCDADVAFHMLKRLLGLKWEELPYEIQAGPYRMKMNENGGVEMSLPTAECILEHGRASSAEQEQSK